MLLASLGREQVNEGFVHTIPCLTPHYLWLRVVNWDNAIHQEKAFASSRKSQFILEFTFTSLTHLSSNSSGLLSTLMASKVTFNIPFQLE